MQGAHHEGPANLRGVQYVHCVMHKCIMGPSIKYVTIFLANFDPPSPVTLCHTTLDPRKYVTHLGPSQIFSRPSIKKTWPKAFCTNSFSIVHGAFCLGDFVGKVLSGVVFVRSPFCQNTSDTKES